jgi:septal ring factor EnvC (AmiA/AmiB activator)
MDKTKIKLKRLETSIGSLKLGLNHAQNKTNSLKQSLAIIEKKIGVGVHQLQITEHHLQETQHKIAHLQQQADQWNKQLLIQQQLLAKQVRARYTMGNHQPLKWLLNQDTPDTTDRLLTLYQYVVRSRQQRIAAIQQTKKNLSLNQEILAQEITKQEQLKKQFNKNQQKLAQNKSDSTHILQTLDKEIQSTRQTLIEYQKNKNSLSALLKTLTQQSLLQTRRPFVSMRKKLPSPVGHATKHPEHRHQGLIFFAKEGTPVNAVFPGKIVFSDWLNGYGLLIIIDHGRDFMTLYAHNQSLFKQKGDIVDQGTQIAMVGHSGRLKENGLYFEIRRRGRAVSPQEWLG